MPWSSNGSRRNTRRSRPLRSGKKDLLWRCRPHALGSSRGAQLGQEGRNACRRNHRRTPWHEPHFGGHRCSLSRRSHRRFLGASPPPFCVVAQGRNTAARMACRRRGRVTHHAAIPAYYVGLERRRFNARHHVRKILALAEIYPADAVARAISDGLAAPRSADMSPLVKVSEAGATASGEGNRGNGTCDRADKICENTRGGCIIVTPALRDRDAGLPKNTPDEIAGKLNNERRADCRPGVYGVPADAAPEPAYRAVDERGPLAAIGHVKHVDVAIGSDTARWRPRTV
jgi:hypothetical protein